MMRQVILDMLELFEAHYGPRNADPAMRIASWEVGLSGLTDEQISQAAPQVLRYHTHGWPTAAVVRQAVEGKTVRVPILATDVHARRILRNDGSYQVEGWVSVKVPYGADYTGNDLDLDNLPPGCHRLNPPPTRPDPTPHLPEGPYAEPF